MIDRTTKLRWRRRYKRSRRQVEDYSQQAEYQLDRHVFKRLNRLSNIRRFVGSWMGLLIILIAVTLFQTYCLSAYYQHLTPVAGGTYEEGIVGTFTNANPLFANTDVDSSISALLFPGLLKYNQADQLVGDLAQSWSSNANGNIYTVTLRPGLKWQDGYPLTAGDVVFTYQTILNPDVQSPLLNSWYGIKVTEVNASTITFTLPDPLSSFPQSLTNGIIPAHILQNVPADEFRSATFNTTDPIGAGPFKMSAIEVINNNPATFESEIALDTNPHYYGGKPKLNSFVINTFNTQAQMISSFEAGNINAMVGLNSLPAKLQNDTSIDSYNIPLTAEVDVFFRINQPLLSDVKVRQALVQAINENEVISQLGYPVIPAKGPLLSFQIGYNSSILELPTNLAAADNLLTADGWILNTTNGIRYKNNQPLSFELTTQDNSEFNAVANNLAQQWKACGADVKVEPLQSIDFDNALSTHDYDSILYGISIGTDPDVFVYWDSEQAQPNSVPGLNLSQYKSSTADDSLEQGRTRTNPQLRAIKYQPFLQAWQTDAPANALYQPRFLYVTRGQVYGFSPSMINIGIDRYSNVANWEIREVKTTY